MVRHWRHQCLATFGMLHHAFPPLPMPAAGQSVASRARTDSLVEACACGVLAAVGDGRVDQLLPCVTLAAVGGRGGHWRGSGDIASLTAAPATLLLHCTGDCGCRQYLGGCLHRRGPSTRLAVGLIPPPLPNYHSCRPLRQRRTLSRLSAVAHCCRLCTSATRHRRGSAGQAALRQRHHRAAPPLLTNAIVPSAPQSPQLRPLPRLHRGAPTPLPPPAAVPGDTANLRAGCEATTSNVGG